MPCHAAKIDKLITVSHDEDVESVLKKMKKEKVDAVVVVDEDGKTEGVFTKRILLKNLLPVSVAMSDGIQLDIKVNAAPGIAKRLKKIMPVKAGDVMERKFPFVHPETPIWEGINMLVQHGSPLLILDAESGKPAGIMTVDSALEELHRLKDSES